jgi:V8-like Glu-specific endopeptidase
MVALESDLLVAGLGSTMDWKQAIVEVRIGRRWGTGVFIGKRWVLTAGHVLKPAAGSKPAPADVSVVYGKTRWLVDALAIHPAWEVDGERHGDMALLRTRANANIVLDPLFAWDPQPTELVAVDGYPDDPEFEFQQGHVTRAGALNEAYFLRSDDLKIVDGLSGAPLLIGDDAAPQVSGIAVWGGQSGGVCLPLLKSTLGLLQSELPQD